MKRQRLRRSWMDIALTCVACLIMLFILSPLVFTFLSSFNTSSFVAFPPPGLTLQWYFQLSKYGELGPAVLNSLYVAAASTMIATAFGVVSSYALVRYSFRARSLLQSLLISPLLFPQIVIGIALLQFYSLVVSPGDFVGLVIGHVVIFLPFVIRIISSAFITLDRKVEEASMNLGANSMVTFWKITIPMIRPAVTSSLLFIFVLSFNNIVLNIFLSSSKMVTMPVLIYYYIVDIGPKTDVAAVISVVGLIAIALSVMLVKIAGRNAFTGVSVAG